LAMCNRSLKYSSLCIWCLVLCNLWDVHINNRGFARPKSYRSDFAIIIHSHKAVKGVTM
jgi:hypothetical protein